MCYHIGTGEIPEIERSRSVQRGCMGSKCHFFFLRSMTQTVRIIFSFLTSHASYRGIAERSTLTGLPALRAALRSYIWKEPLPARERLLSSVLISLSYYRKWLHGHLESRVHGILECYVLFLCHDRLVVGDVDPCVLRVVLHQPVGSQSEDLGRQDV